MVATKKLDHIWDLSALCNGILAGLVSITAGCATVLPWHAMFIGSIGGLVYLGGSRLELRLKVAALIPSYLGSLVPCFTLPPCSFVNLLPCYRTAFST